MARRDETPRDLLFGLLALQVGLINQEQLLAAFGLWSRNKGKALAEILIERGVIDAESRSLLSGMAEKQLKLHGGDAEKSLAAVAVGPSTREKLAALGDSDLTDSVAFVGSPTPASDATVTMSVGTTTSEGQRFRVLRPHAQGGLGAVFVALDGELNREVALKQILDLHADNEISRTRFMIEAEITGGLEHPGIVPVYGLGHYGDGRPYYAMRFIRGDSLKEAIAAFHSDEALKHDAGRRSLALRKLLRRFVDVCNAIDYAHGRGILHRDLKPGNVIVGKHGETLVVDWGLAKAMGRAEIGSDTGERALMPSSSSGSAETLPGSAIGTPAYMSPEQAVGDLEKLGPRSDVYSLGATLYCLLTGKAPFDGTDLGKLLREVQKGALPPPRQLDPSIDKALEAVCLKAMATKPGDRHATARALAEDIDRWAADEPTSAWAEPFSVKARRWMKRNRTVVTAASVALLALLFGTGAVLAVQTRANADLKQSNDALAIANEKESKANAELKQAILDLAAAKDREADRFSLAMDAIRLFHGEVSEDLLLKERKFGALRGKLLLGAADFYGKLERLLEGQADPKSRAALARSYSALAELTTLIGKGKDAHALHFKALAVRRELASQPGADTTANLDLIRSLYSAARSRLSLGAAADALALVGEATALAERLEATGRGSNAARKRLAECLNYTAILLNEDRPGVRDPARAMELNERATSITEGLVASNPGDVESLEFLSSVITHRGILLHDLGRFAEAIDDQQRALAIMGSLAEDNPKVFRYRDLLARAQWNIVGKLSSAGRPTEALAAASLAVANWQKVADDNPAIMTYQNNLAFGLNGLGYHLAARGDFARALEAHERARTIIKALAETDPSVVGYRRNLARSQSEIGWMLQQLGQPAEALAEYEQERASRRIMEAADPTNSGYRDDIANCETNLSAVLLMLGRPGEARAACDRAIAIRERLAAASPSKSDLRPGLAESLLRSGQIRRSAGDFAGAAADWRRAIALFESLPARSGDIAGLEASCHSMLSSLAGLEGAGLTTADGSREAEHAMAILRGVVNDGVRSPILRFEPTLDPLRNRPDFRALRADAAFPDEPFAR
jgi:eukaryotic-like serine/threonine-protein kinase